MLSENYQFQKIRSGIVVKHHIRDAGYTALIRD